MKQLYQIAIDDNQDLSTRYDAVRMMQHLRKTDPVNYLKRMQNNARQRKYNLRRIDWRGLA